MEPAFIAKTSAPDVLELEDELLELELDELELDELLELEEELLELEDEELDEEELELDDEELLEPDPPHAARPKTAHIRPNVNFDLFIVIKISLHPYGPIVG